MRINSSASLGISNGMAQTSRLIERSLQRLSTGKRVNSARDDVAGYSTIVGLESKIRGIQQANLNINQSIGLLQTADAAISVQSDIVQRMREISVQAANGTLSSSDRSKLNNELNALMDEFNRITNETEFGGIKLLDGSFGTKTMQIGAGENDSLDVTLSSLQASSAFSKTIGAGTFKSVVTISVGTVNDDNALADMDGDGDLDIITADDDGTTISVLKNRGDGTFSPRVTQTGGAAPIKMEVGDLNNDGAIDVVVTDDTANTIEVFINNGDGTLKQRVTYDITEAAATEFKIADVDGDGYNDLVVGTATSSFQVLLNDKDGTFGTAVSYSTTGADYASNNIDVGDFDNDGDIDVFTVDVGNNSGNDGFAQLMINDGSGSFSIGATFDASDATTTINSNVRDINNDGNLDVIASGTGSSNVLVRLGDGAGGFAAAAVTSSLTAGLLDLQLADFNNDGNLDFVGRTTANAYLYSGNGAGTFTVSSTITATNTAEMSVGDVDGDGVVDLMLNASASNAVLFFESNTRVSSALADLTISNVADAQLLTSILDDTLDTLTEERASIGLSMTQLEQAAKYNGSMEEAYTDSRSSIEDADLGLETSELTKNQIMQQAQIAALSQANANMQVVLGLLQQF
jgi:flagellin